MTIRLRPHHLLCLLTYVGKGYSPAFVQNYDRIASRLSGGEDILVVTGADDICAPLLEGWDVHCHGASVQHRDRAAARDVGTLLGVSVVDGLRIASTPELFRQMRAGFAEGVTRTACRGCEWSDLCDAVAGAGYDTARVQHSLDPCETAPCPQRHGRSHGDDLRST